MVDGSGCRRSRRSMFSASVPSNAVAREGGYLPVIAQRFSHLNHVQSDASASGKGGHPRDADEKFAKVTAPCRRGEVAKPTGAPRFGVNAHAVASE
ncbi:hypothetical protein ACLK1T_14570 [Escherichia coli]